MNGNKMMQLFIPLSFFFYLIVECSIVTFFGLWNVSNKITQMRNNTQLQTQIIFSYTNKYTNSVRKAHIIPDRERINSEKTVPQEAIACFCLRNKPVFRRTTF